MGSEHFSLSWNNYHVNLSSGFHELLQSEYLVDVTLAVEGQFIKAHKTILSICSPYFQQLFKVNPCKHPIVIMHGMNYSTLYNILQFMYKGEVSVRQEDIPQFLKIAETLKVKGLTERDHDNAQQQSSNGVNSSEFPSNIAERQTQVMKRSKPLKPRPYSKPDMPPVTVPIAQPSTVIETTPLPIEPSTTTTNTPATETPVVPKEEPVDINDENDYYSSTIDEHSAMDVTNTIDAQLGEPSHLKNENSFTHLKNEDGFYKSQQDCTTSGGPLLFLKSRRGHPVLIHSGHMYTLTPPQHHSIPSPPQLTALSGSSSALALRRVTWYCVKQRTLGCGGCLVTTATPTPANTTATPTPPNLLSYSGHNHAQLHDVIQRLQAQSCSPSPELMPPP